MSERVSDSDSVTENESERVGDVESVELLESVGENQLADRSGENEAVRVKKGVGDIECVKLLDGDSVCVDVGSGLALSVGSNDVVNDREISTVGDVDSVPLGVKDSELDGEGDFCVGVRVSLG